MKKFIVIAIAAVLACTAQAASYTKKATLTTTVQNAGWTNVYTAPAGRVSRPESLAISGTTSNTVTVTLIPYGTSQSYTIATADGITNSTVRKAFNDVAVSTSPKIILLEGDKLVMTSLSTVTGSNTVMRLIVTETTQN